MLDNVVVDMPAAEVEEEDEIQAKKNSPLLPLPPSLPSLIQMSLKRPVQAEHARQQKLLNQSFSTFASSSLVAEPLSKWDDAAWDYVLYSDALAHRFSEGGWTLYTWGSGDCGQLGHGVANPERDLEVGEPRQVMAFAASRARLLASGGMTNALVDDDGLWTWGCSDEGALGRDGDENLPALVSLPFSTVIVQVSCGDCHGACVSLGGATFLWGSYRDKDGKTWFPSSVGAKLGPGAVGKTPTLLDVDNVTQVACGANHTMILRGDGSVWSLGLGEQGQLGRPVCFLQWCCCLSAEKERKDD